jgi:hypothetical protein
MRVRLIFSDRRRSHLHVSLICASDLSFLRSARMWRLLQPIYSLVKLAHITRISCIFIPGWLPHIDFFLQNIVEKRVLHIQLPQTPSSGYCDR